DLVGEREQFGWDFQAERLCSFEINRQLEFCGLLDRKIARVCARQNGGDVSGCAAIKVGGIWAISHQTALSDIFAPFIPHGQPKLGRKVDNRLALAGRREGTNQQQSALDACGNRLAHYSLCRLRPWQIDIHEIDSKRPCRLVLCCSKQIPGSARYKDCNTVQSGDRVPENLKPFTRN